MAEPFSPETMADSYLLAVWNGYSGSFVSWFRFFTWWNGQSTVEDLFALAKSNGFEGSVEEWAAYFEPRKEIVIDGD